MGDEMLSLKLLKDVRKRSKAENKGKETPKDCASKWQVVFESPYLQGTGAKRTRARPTVT